MGVIVKLRLEKRRRMGVEWVDLPPEIVELISKRLTIYADYLRFRCVCRSWRASVPKIPLHLPSQLPWLMLSRRGAFVDLFTDKTHLLRLNPPLSSHRTRICGSSHGWLVIHDKTPNIRLLNPITRTTLFLPPLHTFPNVVGFDGRKYSVRNIIGNIQVFNWRFMRYFYIKKIALSSIPSHGDDDFAAVAIIQNFDLVFYRKGYDSWVYLTEKHHICQDVVYNNNGSFFAVSIEEIIVVRDVWGSYPPRVSVIQTTLPFSPPFRHGDIPYAVSSGEDLFMVIRILQQRTSDSVFWTLGFKIFKMNWNMLTWEKIETLGKRAFFIGGNSSVSFSAADFSGCCADCIYFTDNIYWKQDCGIFRLCDQTIVRLPLPCSPRGGCPIWVTPNPC